MKALTAALIALPLLATAHGASAQVQQQTRLRGSIEEVKDDAFTYALRDQEKTITVRITPETRFTAVSGTTLSDIKPGSYVGTAAEPDKDGMLRALEVHIFAEAQRGVGEGFHPFDLTPESTMTNGTVSQDVASTAQVAQNLSDNDARRILTLNYKDGQKKVIVPDDAPIVRLEPATRALVAEGAKANVSGYMAPDGSITATSIAIGTNGLTPPM
jgi:hypothetical protein